MLDGSMNSGRVCVCACVRPCGGGWLVHHAEGPRVTYCRSWALQGEMGGEVAVHS